MGDTEIILDELNEQIASNEKDIQEGELLLENIKQENKQFIEKMEQENKQFLEKLEQEHKQFLEKMEQEHNQFLEKMEQEHNQFLEKMEQEHKQFLEKMEQEQKSLDNIRQESEGIRNQLNLLLINNNENEILNKLEEIELNNQFKNKEEIKCAICLEVFSTGDKISYLPCFHYFHSSCIKNWIKIKNKCPFCNNVIK